MGARSTNKKENKFKKYDSVSANPVFKKKEVEIVPRNVSQETYLLNLLDENKDIVFGIGPAGTGKTQVAMQVAIKHFKTRLVDKIVITRPAVSVDEDLGALPGTLEEKMAPWTRPLMDVFKEYFDSREITGMMQEGILEIAPLSFMRGRAEPLDNLIPTPHGFVKMGDIKVNDYVYGSDGSVTQVTGVYPQGKKDIYEIKFSDGTKIKCSGDHLWNTKNISEKKANKDYSTKTTIEIMNTLKNKYGAKNHEIPMISNPIEFLPQPVELDPYLVGCILGDGSVTQGSVGFTTADEEIISLLMEKISLDYSIKKRNGYDYAITYEHKKPARTLKSALEDLDIWGKYSYEKSIPDVYKFNSIDIRLEVLRGLMDTDGSIFLHKSNKSRQQFYSTSEKLALDVKFIVESLGGVSTLRKRTHKPENRRIKHKRSSYVVDFVLPPDINPFKLSRKADLYNPVRIKRLISDITFVGNEDCQCISVSADNSLYVTSESFIVTHNTFKNSYIIADEMQNSTASQMKMLLTRLGENSKMAVTGDLNQSDRMTDNGLLDFLNKYNKKAPPSISVVQFTARDVVRHPTVSQVLRIYGEYK